MLSTVCCLTWARSGMSSCALEMPILLLMRAMSSSMPLKRTSSLHMHAWVLEEGLRAYSVDSTFTCLHAMYRADLNGLLVLAMAPAFAHAGGLLSALYNT